MPTLEEIQNLVDEAQEDIRNRDFDPVRTKIWPDIKTKIGEYTDLDLSVRRGLGRLIYRDLNKQGLQAGQPTPIILESLKADLEAGRVEVPEPAKVYEWLAW